MLPLTHSEDYLAEGLKISALALKRLSVARHKIVTAESCTGGLISALLVHHSGASEYIEGAFVTYSNELKKSVLHVHAETLERSGAVSKETAQEMAEGALYAAPSATLSVSVSGIAGPSGGTEEKPVGLVCFALAVRGGGVKTFQEHFDGDRTAVRWQAALYALQLVIDY